MNKESTRDKKLMHPVYGNGVISSVEEGEAGCMVKAIFEGIGEKEFFSMVNPLEEKH